MHTVTRLPIPRSAEQEALLNVVSLIRRMDWDRVGVGVIAVFHLWLSATLLFAPDALLFTQGSAPAFDLLPPSAWCLAFGAGGILAVILALHVTPFRQAAAWMVVLPSQAVWLGASVISVSTGHGGSAIGVVVWSVVIALTGLQALRLAFDYVTGKR